MRVVYMRTITSVMAPSRRTDWLRSVILRAPPGTRRNTIPKVWRGTAGTRHYDFDNTEKGAVSGSFFCYEAGPAPCLNYATNVDAENLHTKYKGFKSRANLTWHILPDVLVYYTWSQGFRPGAFNRNFACYIPDAKGVALYCSPIWFTHNTLTNNDFGWKTQFFAHTPQRNG